MPSLNESKQQTRPTWLANHTPLADFPSSRLTGVKKGKEERGGFKGWVCDLWDGIALRDECQQEENDQNMAQKRLHVEKS